VLLEYVDVCKIHPFKLGNAASILYMLNIFNIEYAVPSKNADKALSRDSCTALLSGARRMNANCKQKEGGLVVKIGGPSRRPSAVTCAEVKQTDQLIRYSRKIGTGEISSEMSICSVKKGVRVAYGSAGQILF